MAEETAPVTAAEKRVTLTEHLRELRRRITYCLGALVVTIGLSFIFVERIFDFFRSRAPDDVVIIYIGVTELITTYFKLAIYCGVALALPFLLFQAMLFIAPGLTRGERRSVTLFLVAVIFFFSSGAVFTYLILLPPALNFLLNFQTDIAEPMISIGSYISVTVRLIFWIGVVFNIPISMYFLSRIGVVSPAWLAKNWKWAFLVAFALGAIITPTMDPFNQTLVAAPIVVLYLIGVALAQLARRGKRQRALRAAIAEQE